MPQSSGGAARETCLVVRPTVQGVSLESLAKAKPSLSLLSGYNCPHKLSCLRALLTQAGQMGKLRRLQSRQATSAPHARKPCPVQRRLGMLWKLLESTQGDEMLVTPFPATVSFCRNGLSFQVLTFRGKSQGQKALWVWL